MLEQAAGAVFSGFGPYLQLAEFAAQREVAEDQEGCATIAVGARERDTDLSVFAGKFDHITVMRPEGGIERAIVDHSHRKAFALDHILQPHDVLDRLAVAAFPAEFDPRQPGVVERFRLQMLPDQPAFSPNGQSALQTRLRSAAMTRLCLTVRTPSGTASSRKISPRLSATSTAATIGVTGFTPSERLARDESGQALTFDFGGP